jgi:hypothetical protein
MIRIVKKKKKMKNVFLGENFRGKHNKYKSLDPNIKESVQKHIELFPTVESHYLKKYHLRLIFLKFKHCNNVLKVCGIL